MREENEVVTKFSLIFILSGFALLSAQPVPDSLKLKNLEELLRSHSPKWKMIDQNIAIRQAEKDIDLQWSNFSLDLEHENLSENEVSVYETSAALTKNIEMPWIYSERKNAWQAELQATQSMAKDEWNSFLADMKSGYVELALLEEQTQTLKNIRDVLQNISGTARTRYKEGSISGLEQDMIQMALFTTEAEISELSQRHINLAAQWKTSAGLDHDQPIRFLSRIAFIPVKEKILRISADSIQISPRVLAYRFRSQAAQQRLEMEKMKIVPDFSISAGYKKANPQFKGYTIGLSLPLPVLNQNRAQISRQRNELLKYETEYDLVRSRIKGQIKARKNIVLAIESTVADMAAFRAGTRTDLEQISISYREGWLNLNEMLNSIKVYYDFIQAYNQQLLRYYQAIFFLEALTGQELLSL